MDLLTYLLAGAFTGLLSGLFGVGGGLIIVPILTFIFARLHFPEAHIMHMAVATSLATIILTSVSSAWSHHGKSNVSWLAVKAIAPGIIVGTLLGSILAAQFDSSWLKIIFVIFGLLVATQLLLNLVPPHPRKTSSGVPETTFAGAVIGMVSSFVGIGGGTLSVPYLIYCNAGIHKAIGTSTAIGLVIAVSSTLGFVMMGLSIPGLPEYSAGFVYLPAFAGIATASMLTAPLGTHIAHRLPAPILKRLFAILLMTVSISMLWDFF